MHISEGVLSGPVLLSGAALAAAGTGIGLKRLDLDRIAQAGILAAAFFVASLVHIPVGPSSVHLIMNGIVGLLLGWAAFPTILVALILQALLFQYGGITTLGVNTLIMAVPALVCSGLFGRLLGRSRKATILAAFAGGSVAVLLSALIMALFLVFTEEKFFSVAVLVVLYNLPVMVIEGIVTAFCVLFLLKVQPSLLAAAQGVVNTTDHRS